MGKYQVGDKVKVKDIYHAEGNDAIYQELSGKVVEIADVWQDGSYHIKEDDSYDYWDDESFECLVSRPTRIPLPRFDSCLRYVDKHEKKETTEIRKRTTEEYQRLLYIELPSLINRIVNTRIVPVPVIPELVSIATHEIRKIAEEECNSIETKYNNYLKSPNADTSGENN